MSELRNVRVELGERSYPIYIGSGLLGRPDLVAPCLRGRQVCLVSNVTVAPLYLARVKAALAGFDTIDVILPDGEEYKTLDQVARIYDALLEADRTSDV